MSNAIPETQFDSGDGGATIATTRKVVAKRGRVVITDGHIGLLQDNGDLIDSAPVSGVLFTKGFTYALVPTLHVVVNGTKYLVNLMYEASINSGLGDGEAKDVQREANKGLIEIVRNLGAQLKGL